MATSTRRRRSGNPVEDAMLEQREAAIEFAKEAYPDSDAILVSFFDNDVIVDLKDKDGTPQRFRFIPEDNTVALEKALQSGRIKVVTYEQPK